MRNAISISGIAVIALIGFVSTAVARDVRYSGSEEVIYVKPGEPTQISFPNNVEGGFLRKQANVTVERQDNHLIVFAQPALSPEGEAIIVHLNDKRTYSIRVLPATDVDARDDFVSILDDRPPVIEEEAPKEEKQKPGGVAPPTVVSGLMREMILIAEFGKKQSIPGYRRSTRYAGETVLHDGTISATISEIYMGANLWGYVLDVENLMDANHKINPASFRLDGTHAVSADRWDLAPRPMTAEQKIADGHRARVYVVTRKKR